MTRLYDVTVGKFDQLKRVLAESGFDGELIDVLIDGEKGKGLAKGMVSWLHEQLGIAPAPTVLIFNSDGSVSKMKVVYGGIDEQIVADFKAAGWGYINPAIRSDRRIEIPGKPEITTGTKRMLTIKNVVPSGEVWKFQKAVDTIGATALAFDLEDLRNLVLGHEEELLKRGIRWVIAPAARFRNDNGYECVAYANLEDRKLYLYWVEFDWDAYDWFGSSK